MATYYVRHDGTQTDKANATSGVSAATSLSIAGFNGETFAAGDIVIFKRSGNYTATIAIAGTGAEGNPITFMGEGADEASHAVVDVGAGVNGVSVTGDHLHIKNFSVSADDNKCFFVAANSGIGGHTVKFFDCISVENPNGDGFGTSSPGSDASEVEFIRCQARAIVGTNNQGFTTHNAQKVIMTDCSTTRECETAMTHIGAEAIINGGEFYAFGPIFFAGQGCQMIVNNAIGIADAGAGAYPFRIDSDGTRMTFNNCDIRHLAPSTANNSLINNDVRITMNGGRFEYSGGGTSGFEWASAGAAGGVLRFTGCRLVFGVMGARLARTNTAGGAILVERCVLDLSNLSGSGVIIPFEIRNTSNGLRSALEGCLVFGPVPANFILMRALNNTVSPVDVYNNTIVDINGAGSDVIASLLSTATATITIKNNIFHNCVDAIQGSTGVVKDYNVYSGSTPDESDTNGLTSDPLFVDPNIRDYRLAAGSPCIGSGNGLRARIDAAGVPYRNPPSRGAYEYRTVPPRVLADARVQAA